MADRNLAVNVGIAGIALLLLIVPFVIIIVQCCKKRTFPDIPIPFRRTLYSFFPRNTEPESKSFPQPEFRNETVINMDNPVQQNQKQSDINANGSRDSQPNTEERCHLLGQSDIPEGTDQTEDKIVRGPKKCVPDVEDTVQLGIQQES